MVEILQLTYELLYCTCFVLEILKVPETMEVSGPDIQLEAHQKMVTQILPRSMILFDVFLYAEKRCALRHLIKS